MCSNCLPVKLGWCRNGGNNANKMVSKGESSRTPSYNANNANRMINEGERFQNPSIDADNANKMVSEDERSRNSSLDAASVNELMVKVREEYKDIGVSLGETIDIENNSEIRNGFNTARDGVMIKDLPHHQQMSFPDFIWDEIDGETFAHC